MAKDSRLPEDLQPSRKRLHFGAGARPENVLFFFSYCHGREDKKLFKKAGYKFGYYLLDDYGPKVAGWLK